MSADVTVVLLGPTASGKSSLALGLARRYQGELISCDSMQVYRGLPIGTAQPSREEQQEIPHHLVHFLPLSARWDANLFVDEARKLIPEIRARHHLPIVVGGTGLYAKSLCYSQVLLPSDKKLLAEICQIDATAEGHLSLLEEMARATGCSVEELPEDIRMNPRRLQRGIEVLRLTGMTPRQHHEKNPPKPLPGFREFILMPPFELLKERIRLRTRQMLQAGWREEAIAARRQGLLESPTALQALGYRDILENLDLEEEKLAELLANRTIQYARRQMTWFKNQHPAAIQVTDPAWNPSELLKQIIF